MKFISLILFTVILASCSESTNIAIPLKKDDKGQFIKPETISWKAYLKYCGPQNIQSKQNFIPLKGVQITWEGTIYAIREDAGVKDSRQHAPKIIQVKMEGSSSLLSDITLRLPKGSGNIYGSMKKDDKIIFRGKIGYLGSKLNDHIILVEKFKKKK